MVRNVNSRFFGFFDKVYCWRFFWVGVVVEVGREVGVMGNFSLGFIVVGRFFLDDKKMTRRI